MRTSPEATNPFCLALDNCCLFSLQPTCVDCELIVIAEASWGSCRGVDLDRFGSRPHAAPCYMWVAGSSLLASLANMRPSVFQ